MPSPLDPSFGTRGKVRTFVGGRQSRAGVLAMRLTGSNRIAAAGRINFDNHRWSRFALARYHRNGVLDTSFGRRGRVVRPFNGRSELITAAVFQPDGKIVATGSAGDMDGRQVVVARYHADGRRDAQFGTGGRVIIPLDHWFVRAVASAIQPDGGIVVLVEVADNEPQLVSWTMLTRYRADGTLDASFGDDGVVTTSFGGTNERPETVAVQGDGRIVVGGKLGSGKRGHFALIRHNANGSLDTGFGEGGATTVTFGRHFSSAARAVAFQDDGRIVAAGVSGRRNGGFAVARFNADGSLDTTFGDGGKVLTGFSAHYAQVNALALDPTGRIVTAGEVVAREIFGTPFPTLYTDFAIARYRRNGRPDWSFTPSGKTHTDFGGFDDSAQALAIQSNGRILVGGDAWSEDPDQNVFASRFALARYR